MNVHYTKDSIYKYILHTYQPVLHLIENDEAYKQKEPTGEKRGKERMKERQSERKAERKKERKKERVLRQESDKGGN